MANSSEVVVCITAIRVFAIKVFATRVHNMAVAMAKAKAEVVAIQTTKPLR